MQRKKDKDKDKGDKSKKKKGKEVVEKEEAGTGDELRVSDADGEMKW